MASIFFQDIEAILDTLRLKFQNDPGDDPEAVPNEIGHLQVESGTEAPYIILIDVNSIPIDAFQHTEVAVDGAYKIRYITQDTETQSAQTIAGKIHKKVYEALHGVPFPVSEYKNLSFRCGPREMTHWEQVSSEVSYLHSGHNWFGMVAKNK